MAATAPQHTATSTQRVTATATKLTLSAPPAGGMSKYIYIVALWGDLKRQCRWGGTASEAAVMTREGKGRSKMKEQSHAQQAVKWCSLCAAGRVGGWAGSNDWPLIGALAAFLTPVLCQHVQDGMSMRRVDMRDGALTSPAACILKQRECQQDAACARLRIGM